MTDLFQNRDGANASAQAVLAYLSHYDGIEESYNAGGYDAKPTVARWHNCREQGYVASMRNKHGQQINIAWFEHRNSDSICAIEWQEITTYGNPPNIDSKELMATYTDKFAVSHTATHDGAYEMAEWIYKALQSFWSNK